MTNTHTGNECDATACIASNCASSNLLLGFAFSRQESCSYKQSLTGWIGHRGTGVGTCWLVELALLPVKAGSCCSWAIMQLLSQRWLCCNPASAWSFTRPGTAGIFNYPRVNLHRSFCWNNKFIPLLLSGMSFCINIYIWVKPKKLPATIKTKELLQSKFRSQPALRTPCTSSQGEGNCNVWWENMCSSASFLCRDEETETSCLMKSTFCKAWQIQCSPGANVVCVILMLVRLFLQLVS